MNISRGRRYVFVYIPKTGRGQLWIHSTMTDIDGVLPRDKLHFLTTFTMVRNPWDRIVSCYHWLRVQRFDHPEVSLAQRPKFDEFVLHPDTVRSFRLNPARRYMTGSDGVEQCRFYIRLEWFNQDATALFDHLGLHLTLPRLNRSQRLSDYRQYYTDQSTLAVAEACRGTSQDSGMRLIRWAIHSFQIYPNGLFICYVVCFFCAYYTRNGLSLVLICQK